MDQYIIDEDRLHELLVYEAVYQCLQNDGVDNWSNFMYGRKNFLLDALSIYEDRLKEEDYNNYINNIENGDFDFIDLAELELMDFKKI